MSVNKNVTVPDGCSLTRPPRSNGCVETTRYAFGAKMGGATASLVSPATVEFAVGTAAPAAAQSQRQATVWSRTCQRNCTAADDSPHPVQLMRHPEPTRAISSGASPVDRRLALRLRLWR